MIHTWPHCLTLSHKPNSKCCSFPYTDSQGLCSSITAVLSVHNCLLPGQGTGVGTRVRHSKRRSRSYREENDKLGFSRSGLDIKKTGQNNINHTTVPTQHTLQEKYDRTSPSSMGLWVTHSSLGTGQS